MRYVIVDYFIDIKSTYLMVAHFIRKRLIIIVVLFSGLVNSRCGRHDDFILYGGLDIEEGRAIIEKPDGGYLITGRTRSIGAGEDDMFLINIDRNFDTLFEKSYGGEYLDRSYSIVEIDDSSYALFGYSWEGSLSRRLEHNITVVDNRGEFIKRIIYARNRRDLGSKIIRSSDGGFVLAGMTAEFDNLGQMTIVKTDRQFNMVWQKGFGKKNRRDYGSDVIENQNGYLLIGTYSGLYGMNPITPDFQEYSSIGVVQLDFDGNEIWKYKFKKRNFDFGYSICQVGKRIFALGSTNSMGNGSFDIILLELSSNGKLVNKYTYGGPGFEYGYKIIADSRNDLIIVGASNSNTKYPALYVLKLNTKGKVIFEKRFSGINSVYGYDIIENSDGNYLITGTYKLSETNSDVFLLELDKNGKVLN